MSDDKKESVEKPASPKPAAEKPTPTPQKGEGPKYVKESMDPSELHRMKEKHE